MQEEKKNLKIIIWVIVIVALTILVASVLYYYMIKTQTDILDKQIIDLQDDFQENISNITNGFINNDLTYFCIPIKRVNEQWKLLIPFNGYSVTEHNTNYNNQSRENFLAGQKILEDYLNDNIIQNKINHVFYCGEIEYDTTYSFMAYGDFGENNYIFGTYNNEILLTKEFKTIGAQPNSEGFPPCRPSGFMLGKAILDCASGDHGYEWHSSYYLDMKSGEFKNIYSCTYFYESTGEGETKTVKCDKDLMNLESIKE